MVHRGRDVCWREAIVAAHHPFQFEQHSLANHQRPPGLDQPSRRRVLTICLRVAPVLHVVARQHIAIESDHERSVLAGSKSTGTAARLLRSMPNPLTGTSAGVLATRIST